MKQLVSSRTIDIPDGVQIEVKARKVRVKGPRGESRLPACCTRVSMASEQLAMGSSHASLACAPLPSA